MTRGRQICEGCDYSTSAEHARPCRSEAHWRVQIGGLTFYLCSLCHALAELDWAEKAVPRATEYSAKPYRRQPGHEAANARYDRQFAHVSKPFPAARQLAFPWAAASRSA